LIWVLGELACNYGTGDDVSQTYCADACYTHVSIDENSVEVYVDIILYILQTFLL